MNIKALLLTLLILLTTFFVWHREGIYEPEFPQPWLAKGMANNDKFVQGIAKTVQNIPEVGPFISNISVKHGIRAISGEQSGPDEVKISLNLTWQSIPDAPALRDALDQTAALVISNIFHSHRKISKIRVIIKIPKKRKNVNEKRLGKSLGYKNAAKVFSITRAAWEMSLRQYDRNYNPMTLQGAENILALGDYVVLTDEGWTRGF